eukprot:2371405-Pleurochrysis_carterae.AAC.2
MRASVLDRCPDERPSRAEMRGFIPNGVAHRRDHASMHLCPSGVLCQRARHPHEPSERTALAHHVAEAQRSRVAVVTRT